MMKYLWAAALCAAGSAPAFAVPINTFDLTTDVTLSYPDRYQPAEFTSGVTGGGRTGTLLMRISEDDASGSRPNGFNSAFYNTQGRKFDLAGGTTSLFVDLFVPSSYAGLNQNVSGAEGRTASLWGTGFNDANAISAYPIIEFNNATGGFRTWNLTTGFNAVSGFNGYDQWYQIGFALTGNTLTYFVNGQAVGSSVNANGTTSFGNAILQGYNAGNDYSINFDNLTTTAVPEPATLAVFGALGCVALGYRARRKASAA